MGIRYWTKEEDEYLNEYWGTKSVQAICKHLDRSENAIIVRASRNKLGAFTESGSYITFYQLISALYNTKKVYAYTWTRELWQKNGLKMRLKKVNHSKIWVVEISDFWDFAEKNRHLINFSRLEKNALGFEPPWVEEQRRLDELAHINNATKTKWTPYELSVLKHYAENKECSVNELSKIIGRSEGAIARKCRDLNLDVKIRKNKAKHYSENELNFITQEIIRGNHYASIAEQLGRSEKSLRGVIFQRLGTENPNKVRKLLQSGATLPPKPRIYPKKQPQERSFEISAGFVSK